MSPGNVELLRPRDSCVAYGPRSCRPLPQSSPTASGIIWYRDVLCRRFLLGFWTPPTKCSIFSVLVRGMWHRATGAFIEG